MGEGEIDARGIVMRVEGAWNLVGMGMLSCMRAGIGVSVCVLVLVLVVLVWMWMVLMVCMLAMVAVGDGCGNNGRNIGGSWLCGGGI